MQLQISIWQLWLLRLSCCHDKGKESEFCVRRGGSYSSFMAAQIDTRQIAGTVKSGREEKKLPSSQA